MAVGKMLEQRRDEIHVRLSRTPTSFTLTHTDALAVETPLVGLARVVTLVAWARLTHAEPIDAVFMCPTAMTLASTPAHVGLAHFSLAALSSRSTTAREIEATFTRLTDFVARTIVSANAFVTAASAVHAHLSESASGRAMRG